MDISSLLIAISKDVDSELGAALDKALVPEEGPRYTVAQVLATLTANLAVALAAEAESLEEVTVMAETYGLFLKHFSHFIWDNRETQRGH